MKYYRIRDPEVSPSLKLKERIRNRLKHQLHYPERRTILIERVKMWQARNLERVRATNKKYYLAHYIPKGPRRPRPLTKLTPAERQRLRMQARLRRRTHGDFTEQQWLAIKLSYHYTCPKCNRSEPAIIITMDHIFPLSKGGLHTASNIQPLCKSCNSSKGTQVWFASAKFLLPAPKEKQFMLGTTVR